MSVRVLIMAGGTGGHVFPALAVARELEALGAEVSWLGSRGGMEAELVGKAGLPLDLVSIGGLRGKGAAGWLTAPFRIVRATLQSLSVMRRIHPDAVLGMGGFVSGPGGVAARLLRKPLVIHEQNAVAGLTNRLLARIATRVLEAFPGTFDRATTVGNPVREAIAAVEPPQQRYAGRQGPLRLFVFGGSLGAASLNSVVPAAVAALPESKRPQVKHQAGRRNLEEAQRNYRSAGVEAEVIPFVDEMAEAYSWADLVICRAGALTVAELAAAGAPALLVPFPYAVDDHQTANGRFLAEAGAARLVPQSELSAPRLTALLEEFGGDRGRLLDMAQKAKKLARPEATRAVADICLAATRGGER